MRTLTALALCVVMLVVSGCCPMLPNSVTKPRPKVLHDIEGDVQAAALAKAQLIKELGPGNWEFKCLSSRNRRDGTWSAFGSIQPASDVDDDLKLRPWTATYVEVDGNLKLSMMTYGFDKRVIFDASIPPP